MKRILMMVFRNSLLVPYMWCKLCYYASHVEKYTEKQRYDMLKFIVKRANRGGNVHIDVHGQDNIPKEDGFMFFPNHQGLYDVLAIVDACPEHPFSVVAKQEVRNVQFLKQVFACMKAFTIDRDDVRQSMKVIMAVSEEVKSGRNYLIFPEGTRSKAKCPIVPVALIDSFKPFDTKTISQVDVQVHFLKPMFYEEYKDMKTVEIAGEVKRRIEEVIKENER